MGHKSDLAKSDNYGDDEIRLSVYERLYMQTLPADCFAHMTKTL